MPSAGVSAALFYRHRPVALYDFTYLNDLDSSLTFSRAGQAMIFDGSYWTYAPNNLIIYSGDVTDANWTKGSAGVASAPAATTVSAVNPLGATSSVSRVVFALNGGTASGDISQITNNTTTTSAGVSTIQGFWIRSNTASTYTMTLVDTTGTAVTSVTVTPSWSIVYAKTSNPSIAGSGGLRLRLRGGEGTSDSADVLIYTGLVSAVTYESTPRSGDQVITTSAAYYGPRLLSYDPSTLTRNGLVIEAAATQLAPRSEGGVAGASGTSNVSNSASSITGYATSVDFGNNSVARVLYYTTIGGLVAATQYTLEAVVQMDDGNAPTMGTSSTTGDVAFVLYGSTISPPNAVKNYGSSQYLVSTTFTTPGVITDSRFGFVKYTTQSARTFRVTGWYLRPGAGGDSYIVNPGMTSVTRAASSLASAGALTTALAAGRSIVEWTDIATGTTSRQDYAAGGFSFSTGKIYRYLAVYAPGVTAAYTGSRLTVGGPF